MSELKMTIRTTKTVPVTVLSFKWVGHASIRTAHFKCTICKNPVGTSKLGVAFLKRNDKQFSARLCHKCGEIAEKEARG